MTFRLDIDDNSICELDINIILDTLRPATAAGREWLRTRLTTPTTNPQTITSRQETIRKLKTILSGSNTVLSTRTLLASTEDAVVSMTNIGNDERHAEYYNQLMWSPSSKLAPLNTWGWLAELIVAFRSIALPIVAVLMPILLFLAPLGVLLMGGKQITTQNYNALLQQVFRKAMPSVMSTTPRFTGAVMASVEQVVSIMIGTLILITTAWSQISGGLSLYRAVADMRARATAVQRSSDAVRLLVQTLALGGIQLASETPQSWPISTLSTFGMSWNNPQYAQNQLAAVGELDGLISLALAKRTCFPTFTTEVKIQDLWHPGLICAGSRVYNSINMGTSDTSDTSSCHVLLTGPNRGGKTTVLKSLGTAVLMAQSVGIVFARRATLPIFKAFRTSLRPMDVLGKRSLFETEIDFARDIHTLNVPLFLIMDEIFHGTNALDGVEAATVFLDKLYKTIPGSVYSAISTHYIELPNRYGVQKGLVQPLCMDSVVDPSEPDRILSSYRLKTGVNTLSSVREILRERGLL